MEHQEVACSKGDSMLASEWIPNTTVQYKTIILNTEKLHDRNVLEYHYPKGSIMYFNSVMRDFSYPQ